jgi:hypothetical protein
MKEETTSLTSDWHQYIVVGLSDQLVQICVKIVNEFTYRLLASPTNLRRDKYIKRDVSGIGMKNDLQ